MERIRKVDVSTLSKEQFVEIQAVISKKMEEIAKKAVEEANVLLNIYGMECTIRMDVQEQGKPQSSKKSRKAK
jgi:hypothetical protein